MEQVMSWEQAEVVRLLKGQPGTQYQQSTDVERTVMRDWVRSMLQAGIVTVEFTKSDGSVREMQCTLNYTHIPIAAIPASDLYTIENNSVTLIDGIKRKRTVKEDSAEPKEESTIRVYDIEAAGWRSFRYDRLRKISVTVDFQ
jgi:hypothetical protein